MNNVEDEQIWTLIGAWGTQPADRKQGSTQGCRQAHTFPGETREHECRHPHSLYRCQNGQDTDMIGSHVAETMGLGIVHEIRPPENVLAGLD
jgi:hypothetical protein